MRLFKRIATAAITTAALATASFAGNAPYKIYLSMSYIGNDWQAESSNAIRAMAASTEMKDKVSLEVQVAGPNAQKQIQQINAMVQAGAQAIIIFPISPTASPPWACPTTRPNCSCSRSSMTLGPQSRSRCPRVYTTSAR